MDQGDGRASRARLPDPDGVFDAITKTVPIWYVLDKDTELPYLRKIFDSLATEENGTK